MNIRSSSGWLSPYQALFVVLASFAGGVSLERFGLLPGGGASAPPGVRRTFEPFWEAWRVVDDFYVDREAVQPRHMTEGAIRGMLASLGDVGHTTYLNPAEWKEMENSLKGQMEGIGARVVLRKNQPVVVGTVPGSPAREKGLHAGDILLEVNGKAIAGLPLDRVVNMVRGPAGTTVHLRVLHTAAPSQDVPLLGATVLGFLAPPRADGLLLTAAALLPEQGVIQDYDIVRAKVDVPVLAWTMVPGAPLAHIALREFGHDCDVQLRQAIKEARAQGARGLVVDVRLNPGGLKDQAVKVTSEFLQGGDVFLEQDARGQRKAVKVLPDGIATDIPLVVLIDEGSASSSEIFAGAIQDHERGQLVGSKTFGTGTVLLPFHLSDGSAVLLAVEEWLTPKGRVIWHQGIAPDIEVPLPAGARLLFPEDEARLRPHELAQVQDVQFLEALKVLRRQLGLPEHAVAARREP